MCARRVALRPPDGRSAGHSDRDFFTGFDPPHEFGRLLPELAQSRRRHSATIAQVLPAAVVETSCPTLEPMSGRSGVRPDRTQGGLLTYASRSAGTAALPARSSIDESYTDTGTAHRRHRNTLEYFTRARRAGGHTAVTCMTSAPSTISAVTRGLKYSRSRSPWGQSVSRSFHETRQISPWRPEPLYVVTPGQTWCPRQDSNLRHRLRRAVLYPLSYGGRAPGKP